MVSRVADFDYILTDTEREALVLESNLIKELRPHYNIRIKDDKHYPYLRLGVRDDYPKLTVVRRVEKDGARYFGPYPNGGAVREMLKRLKRVFPLRNCSRELQERVEQGRPCLNYHLKQCLGPCRGAVSRDDYHRVVRQLEMMLDGRHDILLSELKRQMKSAADNLDFERAAFLRDQIGAVQAVVERQKFDAARMEDRDILGMARGLEEACVVIFHMRDGKVVGRDSVFLTGTLEQSRHEVLRAFLTQFYAQASTIPGEILVGEEPEDIAMVAQHLSALRGRKVRVVVPKRGEKKSLAELAARNALQILEERWARISGKQELLRRALAELAFYLGLNAPPQRMECYDISNISGAMSVGSMVVFIDGLPAKDQYRRFRIKWVEGANDFASLHEVLSRRLGALKEGKENFYHQPDLIIVDGGKGQLGAAQDALRQEGLTGIPVVSLAKAEELVFIPGRQEPLGLPPDSQARYLMQRIRDEAHRFAIAYHRGLRSKAGVHSILEDCKGIGAAKRTELLRHFGSIRKMRDATVEELAAVKGMTRNLAQALKAHLDSQQSTK
jgi:excinuclease ABC subunit C